MEPITFKEMNGVAAKDQAQYIPLPMFRDDYNVISCWKMSFLERIKVLFTGVIWLKLLQSKTSLITPSNLLVANPFLPMGIEESEVSNLPGETRLLETSYKDFVVAGILIGIITGGIYWVFSG